MRMWDKKKTSWMAGVVSVVMIFCTLAVFVMPTHAMELMYAEEYEVQVDGETVMQAAPAAEGSDQGDAAAGLQGDNTAVQQKLGCYTNGYDFKRYISMRDLAALLKGTPKQFDFQMDPEGYTFLLTTGTPYAGQEPVMVPKAEPELQEGDYYDGDGYIRNAADEVIWTPEDTEAAVRPAQEYLDLYLNPLQVDGREVRYYTYQLSTLQDLYMNVIDVQLLLDITIEMGEGQVMQIATDRGYEIDLAAYDEDGFCELFQGVALGDATTGEILYSCKANDPVAIASTSKLMTYMVVARYLEMGRISLEDEVILSQNVANLAQGWYGSVWMEAGQKVTVKDLIAAMLIVSSNESALALAEHVAGSEEAFVDLMNDMAQLLGLKTARFYNSNGLPDYSDTMIASRRQNRMSVSDLFRLSAAVLRKYPEVLTYTSAKSMYLDTLGTSVNNTSYLLYNMEDAIGLKTGTTDEAGCCLVGAVSTSQEDGEHILVACIIGAESNVDRYQIPAVLLTWGKQHLANVPKASITSEK